MKWKLPPNVHGYETQHGKSVFYYRRPGQKKIRLKGMPGSEQFMNDYEAAKSGEPTMIQIGVGRTIPGTVNAAVVGYYQSDAFKALAPTTRSNRRAILERFREDHGSKRICLLHSTALQNIISGKTPSAQLNWRKALRGFLDYCLASRLIKADPLSAVKLLKGKSRGHHTWEVDECAQFEQHHALGTRARLAYELLLQAGQSRCDVVRMGRQHIRNGMMSMRRQKTDVPFDVTVSPRLQEAIDAMSADKKNLTFLVTHVGKPFTAAGFGNWFREMCRDAKLPDRCTSHGLRKAAATYLAELGATDHQLMSWFGWTSISQAQVYTKAANRKRMAHQAGQLIPRTGIGSPVNPVSQNDGQVFEKTGARE
ncbi:tyrosine-type recombinase/integrase [Bradyrhizobium sp. Arg816]|uniref:tyrosine-type recombinase/integrase n=1 Tax=Bradyrhizobium sp. Arg816 TaxID=2998491 RepID=UPI00249EE5D0|nr:tyrosine-type recombinase/integrase [Bradyrhizobium sp. Arg816]MDI3560148.1 tyrosine-type recombinase/integrase [Bradyrhizobium sp. Arg816]